jgi:hypothetical protein
VTQARIECPFVYYAPETARPFLTRMMIDALHETKVQALQDMGCRAEVVRVRGGFLKLALHDPLLRRDLISETVPNQEGEPRRAMHRMLTYFDPNELHLARQL